MGAVRPQWPCLPSSPPLAFPVGFQASRALSPSPQLLVPTGLDEDRCLQLLGARPLTFPTCEGSFLEDASVGGAALLYFQPLQTLEEVSFQCCDFCPRQPSEAFPSLNFSANETYGKSYLSQPNISIKTFHSKNMTQSLAPL